MNVYLIILLLSGLDHVLNSHRKYAKNPHDKRSDMAYKE